MPGSHAPIVIIGSINMDLVARVAHIPAPGETVLGRDFSTIPGGKGANQAVAVARLGGRAIMVGRVGDDDFGARLKAGLDRDGVDCTHVMVTPGTASGIAMIVVADSGENAITVASGANFEVSPDDVDTAEPALREARACLLQLELPLETVLHAVRLCRRLGVVAILDPAPAPAGEPAPDLFMADILTPNETEAGALTALPTSSEPAGLADALARRGCRTTVLKLGRRGAYVASAGQGEAVAGFPVEAVDTTAAGDTFTAALAVRLAQGDDLVSATRFANAAGALACTRLGAQPSVPRADEVQNLLDGTPST